MDGSAVADLLRGRFPEGAVEPVQAADGMPTIYVAREQLVEVCRELRDRPELRFVFAADMTAADYMPREPRFEVVIHLCSFGMAGYGPSTLREPQGRPEPSRGATSSGPSRAESRDGDSAKRLRVKVRLRGDDAVLPTISGVWPSMGWAERELWDLFGIECDGNPDKRRILMPEDWEGYPARKDYPVQIKMKPKVYEPLQLTPQEFAKNVRAARERGQQE